MTMKSAMMPYQNGMNIDDPGILTPGNTKLIPAAGEGVVRILTSSNIRNPSAKISPTKPTGIEAYPKKFQNFLCFWPIFLRLLTYVFVFRRKAIGTFPTF